MSSKRFLYLCLVLAMLLSGMVAPLVQPSVALGALPDTPVAQSPSGTTENLTPTLVASTYHDSDNETHLYSDWQITRAQGNYTVGQLAYQSLDDTVNKTSINIALGNLNYGTQYWWRVRYRNSTGASSWSNEPSFTTVAPPVANFTADMTEVGVNQTVDFTDASSGGVAPLTYQWNFGDGGTSTEPNPSHSYSSANTYTVSLTITDAADSTDTEIKVSYMTVAAGLVANFGADRTAVVVGQTVTFTNLTSGGSPFNSYEWDFNNDGAPDSSAVNPTHAYASVGTYTVVLTATTLWDTDNETKPNYITVSAGLVANFAADRTAVAVGQSVQFTNNSSGGVAPLTYQWDFNNDNVTDSTLQSPSHIYGGAGTYTVVLRVADNATNTATETKMDYITVTTEPLADFSADKTLVALGESVQFTNLSGGGAAPLTYQWDFNNDTVWDSTLPNPSHTYSSAGTYTVVLRVTDALITTATQTKANYITVNQPPNPPTNSQPANLATGISLTPTLESSAFSDDVGDTHTASQWQISTVAGAYSSPVFDSDRDASHLVGRVVPSGRLGYSTTYYWHVRHQDNNLAWSEWSAETSFTTVSIGAPDTPTNVSPPNAATSVSITPTLRSSAFSGPDGDTHAASQWQVASAPGGYSTSLVFDSDRDASNLVSQVVPSGRLGYSTTYYWRVRYQDNRGTWSAWSAETSFATLNQGPSQPVNTLPANGATAVGRTSELRSSAFSTTHIGDSHTASQWQISSTSGDYSDPVFDSNTDTKHLTRIAIPSGVLEHSETYYWRVRYQDSNDSWSPWSVETSFTTSAGASGMPFAGWLFIGIGAVAGVAALVYVTFFMKPAERE